MSNVINFPGNTEYDFIHTFEVKYDDGELQEVVAKYYGQSLGDDGIIIFSDVFPEEIGDENLPKLMVQSDKIKYVKILSTVKVKR